MPAHEFTLILSGISEATEEGAEALFEAGCNDGTFASRDGRAFVGFTREAASLLDAIRSAIRDVRKAGFEVSRVEIETAALENA
jgi:hypothetical protein